MASLFFDLYLGELMDVKGMKRLDMFVVDSREVFRVSLYYYKKCIRRRSSCLLGYAVDYKPCIDGSAGFSCGDRSKP